MVLASSNRPKNLQASSSAAKGTGNKASSCAQRIEQATVHRTQVSFTENMVQDAEALFAAHDSEGTALLSRGALTELLREVGLEGKMGELFGATARLAFDAHSADSHFLSLAEFKQLYYVVNQRYPGLLPRTPFLRIHILSAHGLPSADMNGKSDPFVVMYIPGKPQSKSQTTIVDRTLDPVWGRPGVGEEFYDKYAYEEGDTVEFIVLDYDKGTTSQDSEVLGKGKLSSAEIHKPGGFSGEIRLVVPPELERAPLNKGCAPTLKCRLVVNALENAEDAAEMKARLQEVEMMHKQHGAGKFKAAVNVTKIDHHHEEHHHGHEEPPKTEKEKEKPGAAAAPAGA